MAMAQVVQRGSRINTSWLFARYDNAWHTARTGVDIIEIREGSGQTAKREIEFQTRVDHAIAEKPNLPTGRKPTIEHFMPSPVQHVHVISDGSTKEHADVQTGPIKPPEKPGGASVVIRYKQRTGDRYVY